MILYIKMNSFQETKQTLRRIRSFYSKEKYCSCDGMGKKSSHFPSSCILSSFLSLNGWFERNSRSKEEEKKEKIKLKKALGTRKEKRE